MSAPGWPDDDPDIRRAAERQISLRGAGAAAFAARMVEEHRYGSNLSFAMWVKILAKIDELQAAEKPAAKDTEA